jgi:hypothetical protein
MLQVQKHSFARSKYLTVPAMIGLVLVGAAISSKAFIVSPVFSPGNLVVSRSVYQGVSSTVPVGTPLPPNCTITKAKKSNCVTAINDGTYPGVFNNDTVDGSFGVTSPIFLDQVNPTTGAVISTFNVPTSGPSQMVTSFSSKSEIALNLSQDGTAVTFMGYDAAVNAVDVSNANTPGVVDNTNPVGINVSRVIGQVDAFGNFQKTLSNAYSGNNGRAAALANGFYYMTGNSNNGSGTPANVVASAGTQIAVPGQAPGAPEEIGDFSITQIPNVDGGQLYTTPDKLGKDNNFRGLTIFNNTMFVTKGSGSNGINTVYQVGNAGTLPTTGNAANAPITILPGFPTIQASAPGATNPFGIWFANATTLYVADEGDGTVADASTSQFAGLQKWTFANGTWQLDYVLQQGLNLGVPYNVVGVPTYPSPATDGIRNITGRLNNDGTVTIWGVTSTISTSGDQGADPNKLVMITDNLLNTNGGATGGESFVTIKSANYGEVLRGVSFTPGTSAATAAFVGLDSATQGTWKGTYGADGEVIVGDGNNPPAYATVSAPTASTFVWVGSGSDPRFLQKAGAADRIAGTYYSNSTFTIDLNLTPGQTHKVAFYLLDEDGTSRSETISILDAASSRVLDSRKVSGFHNGVYAVWNLQGNVLVEVTNSGGPNAVVSGIFFSTASPTTAPVVSVSPVVNPLSLITNLTATATAGAGANISTVQFFANGTPISGSLTGAGPAYVFPWATTTLPNGNYNLTAVATDTEGQTTTSAPVAATVTNTLVTSASFVPPTDSTTEGTWKGAYGGAGDLIAFDSFAPPAYALASFNQGPPFLWGITGAPQALQQFNSPGRIASAWFGTLTFSLDLNFADGLPHQVSLYFLDWDGAGRAETINVIDANPNNPSPAVLDTEAVSGFGLGKYLTWNVTGHVLIQFNKTAGSNAVVNGVFFNH